MDPEIITDLPDKKIARKTNLKALWIPFISGLLFAIIFVSFIFIWSQSLSESRKLPLTFLNPLNNYFGYIFAYIIGSLAGSLPATPIFLGLKKIYIIITLIVASIILFIAFCGMSWTMMWLINP